MNKLKEKINNFAISNNKNKKNSSNTGKAYVISDDKNYFNTLNNSTDNINSSISSLESEDNNIKDINDSISDSSITESKVISNIEHPFKTINNLEICKLLETKKSYIENKEIIIEHMSKVGSHIMMYSK